MFASFECRDVLFHFSHALVEIASSRTHHYEHAGSVPTLLTAHFFQPIKTLFNRVTKRRNILADRDEGIGHYADRLGQEHTINIVSPTSITAKMRSYYFFSTSTPGSGLPSIHSRKAPPAVEM